MPVLSCLLLSASPYLQIRKIKYSLWVIAILWWVIFFTSHGRGVIVAVIISAITIGLIYRGKSTAFLKQTLFLFILGAIGYSLLFDLIPFLIADSKAVEVPANMTSSGRMTKLWPDAINFAISNPRLGIGPMHYTSLVGAQYFSHPHNSVLQIAAEWGIPTLILILFLIYRASTAWVKRFNKDTLSEKPEDNLFILGLSFSLVAGAVYSLFSGVIVMPMGQLTATLVVSLSMALFFPQYQFSERKSPRSWLMTFFFGFVCVYYFWVLSPELIPHVSDPMYFSHHFLQPNSGPRFWQ